MQLLWSRAAAWNRASCRCIQCASSAPSNARGAGLARYNSAGSFRTPAVPYSTISATIPIADSANEDVGHEDYREMAREKDRMTWLKKAGFTYGALDVDDYNRAFTLGEDIIADEEGVTFLPGLTLLHEVLLRPREWDHFFEMTRNEVDQSNERLIVELEQKGLDPAMWDSLVADSRFPGSSRPHWPVNTGRDMMPHNLPPQSLWSLDHSREKALRKRQTWKKLAIQELSVGMLVLAFAGHSSVVSLSKRSKARLAPDIRQIMEAGDLELSYLQSRMHGEIRRIQETADNIADDRVQRLKDSLDRTYIKPHYYQDKDGHYYDVCAQMNTLLKEIFSSSKGAPDDSKIGLALGKIAHNLLVCSAGPDVHTFNILIAGLRQWNFTKLVDSTIAALDACKMRPNEITCALILDYRIQHNQPDQFAKFIKLMRGAGNALMMARPDININESGGDRLVRDFTKANKVYQKIHPTPLVFDTLMRGVLKFAGLERSLEIYYEMKADGWGLSVLGLTEFLVECIRSRDWNSGLYVWEEMGSLKEAAEIPHLLTAYSHMLSLCTVTGNTAASNHLLKEVSNWGLDRKEIISTSVKITQHLRHQQNTQKPDGKVSALTANKTVNEVSQFVAQGGPAKPAAPTEPVKKQKADIPTNTVPESAPIPTPAPTPAPAPALSKEELWQLWLQNELGLWKNRKAPAPLPRMEPSPLSTLKGPPLSVRLQQELKKKKVHPAPVDPSAVLSKEELWQLWVQNELGLWKNRKAPAPLPRVGPAPLFTPNDPLAPGLHDGAWEKKVAEFAPVITVSDEDSVKVDAKLAHVGVAPVEISPVNASSIELAPGGSPSTSVPLVELVSGQPTSEVEAEDANAGQNTPTSSDELITPFSFLHALVFGEDKSTKKASKQEDKLAFDFIRKQLVPGRTGGVWRPEDIKKIIQEPSERNIGALDMPAQRNEQPEPAPSTRELVSRATAGPLWASWRKQFLTDNVTNKNELHVESTEQFRNLTNQLPKEQETSAHLTSPAQTTSAAQEGELFAELVQNHRFLIHRSKIEFKKIQRKRVCAHCFQKGHREENCTNKPLPFSMFDDIVNSHKIDVGSGAKDDESTTKDDRSTTVDTTPTITKNINPTTTKDENHETAPATPAQPEPASSPLRRTRFQMRKINHMEVCPHCFRKGHTWDPATAPCKDTPLVPFDQLESIVASETKAEGGGSLEDMDIPDWLWSLKLHKYTPQLQDLEWRELVELDDKGLQKRGIAGLGARRKMLKNFEQIKGAKDQIKVR